MNNAKSCNYSEIEYKQMEDIGVRMSRLPEKCGLDTAALWILNGLAKLDKPYLEPIEEKLLALLENEYSVSQIGEVQIFFPFPFDQTKPN